MGGFIVTTTVKLKDQTEVLIRPMTMDDSERSLAFFRALPEEDRACLRRDVTRPEIIQERLGEMEQGTAKRLVALAGDEIVADGALELTRHGWEKHIGELRLIVARPYQHKGLGVLMARALHDLAVSEQIEEIVVKTTRSQITAVKIFRKLGFHEELLLRNYVRDSHGRKQDLVLMRCKVQDLVRQLDDYLSELDLHGRRT